METVVVTAIVVIIAGAILLFAAKLIADIGKESVDREACRNSVLLKERSKVLGKPLIGDITCETNFVEVDDTGLDEIKSIVTNEAYDCWYQFGEGERDFLSDYDAWKGDNWCFVCSRIDYSEDVQKEVSGYELVGYWAENKIPGKSLTFFDYLYGEDVSYTPETDYMNLPTDEPTYVVFFADKRVGDYANPVVGTSIGVLSGIPCVMGIIGTVSTLGIAAPTLAFCGTSALSFFSAISTKQSYVSGLYVGTADEAITYCNGGGVSDDQNLFEPNVGGGQTGGGGASGSW